MGNMARLYWWCWGCLGAHLLGMVAKGWPYSPIPTPATKQWPCSPDPALWPCAGGIPGLWLLGGGGGGLPSEAWRKSILWGPAEGSSVLAVLTRQGGSWLLPCNVSTWGGRSGGWRKANGKPRSHKRHFPRRPKLSWVQIPKALLSAHFIRPRSCRCIWDVACGDGFESRLCRQGR